MATVIKASSAVRRQSGSDVRASVFDLPDMSGKAEEYLESVRREAAQIIQNAHEKAARVQRTAEAAGRKAALESVDSEVEKRVGERVQTVLPAVRQAVQELLDQQACWHRHAETTLVRLAIAIAERLVRGKLEREPQISLSWIRECLEISAGAAQVALRLHPQTLEGLSGAVEAISAEIGRVATPELLGDESIHPGECVVRTGFGTIDMRLEAQLLRIEEELLGE